MLIELRFTTLKRTGISKPIISIFVRYLYGTRMLAPLSDTKQYKD